MQGGRPSTGVHCRYEINNVPTEYLHICMINCKQTTYVSDIT